MKTGSYFPHDSNAKDDPKCMLLIDQLGLEGYGIFWMLIETLRDQPDFSYPFGHTSILAKRYNTSKEKIETVILNFDLFHVKNDLFFYSESLINRMAEIANKKLKQSDGGKKGMLSRWKSNQLQLPETQDKNNLVITNLEDKNNLVITSKVKESKVKENKEINVSVFSFKDSLINLGIEKQIVEDWLKVRKTKKATNTETAFNLIKKQIEKSGMSANECIKISVENSWSGFNPDWVPKKQPEIKLPTKPKEEDYYTKLRNGTL